MKMWWDHHAYVFQTFDDGANLFTFSWNVLRVTLLVSAEGGDLVNFRGFPSAIVSIRTLIHKSGNCCEDSASCYVHLFQLYSPLSHVFPNTRLSQSKGLRVNLMNLSSVPTNYGNPGLCSRGLQTGWSTGGSCRASSVPLAALQMRGWPHFPLFEVAGTLAPLSSSWSQDR